MPEIVKIGPAGPAKWLNVKVKCIFYFFIFIVFLALETTFLRGSTPFCLRQMTCFGGVWFPMGYDCD